LDEEVEDENRVERTGNPTSGTVTCGTVNILDEKVEDELIKAK
jgi:hypothetical protein